jgi:hypothetical protein
LLHDLRKSLQQDQKQLFLRLDKELENEKDLQELLDLNEVINDTLKHQNRVKEWGQRTKVPKPSKASKSKFLYSIVKIRCYFERKKCIPKFGGRKWTTLS